MLNSPTSFNKQTTVLVPVTRLEPLELINIPYSDWPESIRATAHILSSSPHFLSKVKNKITSDPRSAKKYLIEAINDYQSDAEMILRQFGVN